MNMHIDKPRHEVSPLKVNFFDLAEAAFVIRYRRNSSVFDKHRRTVRLHIFAAVEQHRVYKRVFHTHFLQFNLYVL